MRTGLIIFALSAALTCVFIIDLCSVVYSCGCQSWWSASSQHCNIHNATGKHCPWCTHGGAGFVVGAVFIFGAQGWICFRPRHWGWPKRLALSILSFPVVGTIGAIILGLHQGSWF